MENWRELNCGESEDECRTLGSLFEEEADDIRHAVRYLALNDDGSIDEWQDMFVWADGEEPAWDTPHVPVDWTGFADLVRSYQTDEAARSAGRAE